jgi:hypothetical protein
MRVQNGLIVSSRDYGKPLEASALFEAAEEPDAGTSTKPV